MEHYTEVGTADSVAAFRSFPDAPPGRYCGLNKKYVLLLDFASDYSCRQQRATTR